MKLDLDVSGFETFYKYCGTVEATVNRLSKKAALKKAEAIMDESLQEVPRDTGALASSAFIEQDGTEVTFGYGGPNDQVNPRTGQGTSEYMVAVHVRLDTLHPQGKAKFLEDPVNNNRESILSELAGNFRDWLRG